MSWFELVHAGQRVQVVFRPSPDRFWDPHVVREFPLPSELGREPAVELTGAGPVWMYAHAAAVLAAAGVAAVEAVSKGAPGTATDLAGSDCRLIHAQNMPRRCLLVVELQRDPPLAEEAIGSLLAGPLNQLAQAVPEELCVTGQASVGVYTSVARRAVGCGVERLTCWTPVDGLVVAYDRQGRATGQREEALPGWLQELVPPPQSPVIVGVAGDVNVGKSVFSLALYQWCVQMGLRTWRLDCDGQSPTPPWYLSLVRQRATEAANLAREAIKRPWTAPMEDYVARQLRLMRRCFDESIADLPGGNHQVRPPERLPPGRERIFREIDALVLLERADRSTERAWREALRGHGLEERLAAVLRSSNPEAAPRLSGGRHGDVWRGEAAGLNRVRPAEEMAAVFADSFTNLWPALTAHGRRLRRELAGELA